MHMPLHMPGQRGKLKSHRLVPHASHKRPRKYDNWLGCGGAAIAHCQVLM